MIARPAAAAALALALSACVTATETQVAPVTPVEPSRATAGAAGPVLAGPLLGPDGRCTGPAPQMGVAIETGIAECDLVRLKGKPPTDVLIGESGKGQREVQVLYAEPGGRELYFFVDNRLDRIVR